MTILGICPLFLRNPRHSHCPAGVPGGRLRGFSLPVSYSPCFPRQANSLQLLRCTRLQGIAHIPDRSMGKEVQQVLGIYKTDTFLCKTCLSARQKDLYNISIDVKRISVSRNHERIYGGGHLMNAKKSTLARITTALAITLLVLLLVFGMGRYGWKLGGFRACQSAGITSVEVSGNAVQITGFYPGSFPEGFCGCYSQERDGKLYVGFRFSAVFGFFETGDFDITIPVQGMIDEVVLKTRMDETMIWNAQSGAISQTEQYGVYVKLEGKDVYSVSMSYNGSSGGVSCADGSALESGAYLFVDNDIMIVSKEADAPVSFTITVKDADGTAVASGEFSFDANQEKMYLTVTADGRIMEEKDYEG